MLVCFLREAFVLYIYSILFYLSAVSTVYVETSGAVTLESLAFLFDACFNYIHPCP